MEAVSESTEKIATLSTDLLGLDRTAAERSLVPSTTIIRDCLSLLSPNKIRSKIAYYGDVPCSHLMIVQALVCLLDNGLKAAGPGGDVSIECERDSDQAVFIARDNGKGVSPTLTTKIFEPFFSTRSPQDGTGLGLAVARAAALHHSGTLSYARERETTVFALRLPLT